MKEITRILSCRYSHAFMTAAVELVDIMEIIFHPYNMITYYCLLLLLLLLYGTQTRIQTPRQPL